MPGFSLRSIDGGVGIKSHTDDRGVEQTGVEQTGVEHTGVEQTGVFSGPKLFVSLSSLYCFGLSLRSTAGAFDCFGFRGGTGGGEKRKTMTVIFDQSFEGIDTDSDDSEALHTLSSKS